MRESIFVAFQNESGGLKCITVDYSGLIRLKKRKVMTFAIYVFLLHLNQQGPIKKDIKIKWWKFSLITKTDYLRQTDVLPFTGLDHYLCV